MLKKTINISLAIITLVILTTYVEVGNRNIADKSVASESTKTNVSMYPSVNNSNVDMELFLLYLTDIEEQTNRKISDEQRNLLITWVSNNNIGNLDKSITNKHRADFNSNKKNLLIEWGNHYNETWTRYSEDVISDKSGEILRRKGNNYDAHHIIELDYGGVNEWWNLHPAKFPDEHNNGIHRKGSIGNMLFSK